MNKNDIRLIGVIFFVIVVIFLFTNINKKEGDIAKVYYEDKLVLTLDLNKDGEYTVEGYLGEVTIEVKDKMVRVKKENSPRHLCSKEGYTNDSLKPIICLPNKIVIKIISRDNDIDGVVY